MPVMGSLEGELRVLDDFTGLDHPEALRRGLEKALEILEHR